jgi:NAD(P)-dependent dehydrogenase (short-subunit alcohol dehydrogenase family)
MSQKPVAIVTGAVKGIGKAICKALTGDGFYVIAVDIDEAEGKNLIADSAAGTVEYSHTNICVEGEVKRLFADVKQRFGTIGAVVNNAGIIRDNMIWKMTADDFDAVINVNLKGTWLMCREAAIVMKEQNAGKIVNIASRAWLGNLGQSNYSASKAGVVALTRVLALELGRYNISVNAIAPGLIDTPLTQKLEKEVLQKLIDAQPSRSMGSPADVASAVSFLVAGNTKFITGQTIYVDGGKSIGANMAL